MTPTTSDPTPVTLTEAVTAAQISAVVVDRSNLGMLKFSGETRLDLIHRMSTQDLNILKAGMGAATILTTDIGRMIDRLILYAGSTDVYTLTGEDNADNIARYLMRFVFFNDDFQIQDLSAETRIWGVYGREATIRLSTLFETDLDMPLHHWKTVIGQDDRPVYIMRTDPIFGTGYLVMSEGEDLSPTLIEGDLTWVSEQAFDYLRIASGRPRFGYEITTDYIPLEANLWTDVSFSKGCYVGQEIIARMESRGRLAKKLVQFQAEGLFQAGETMTAGGKKAGTATSVADGPLGVLGLGYVKTALLEQVKEGQIQLEAAGVPIALSQIADNLLTVV